MHANGKVPFELVESGLHCLRIFYEHFGTVVSHLHYEITVTKEGTFTGVTVDVDSSSASIQAEVKEEVVVTAAVCGVDTSNFAGFKVGQEFSICVQTEVGYVISSFKNVVCENGAVTKILFHQDGTVDLLTSFDLNAKRFTSVVTTGLIEGDDNQFECTGSVVLEKARRDLQASEENAEGLFAVQIPIAARSDGVDALGIAAPGVASGPLALGTTGAIALAAALL
ncbi:unnamed protein product [Pseudo-nitzschia multistriata]|uniref:Uncharacterized protein n=1 Tax=Pseudo-nitzschia multistriata TaxID=183589 RepID=A0A448ZJE8_9STRA|nr:unnamed protein product [Pseudo-nitzschia multistriata]